MRDFKVLSASEQSTNEQGLNFRGDWKRFNNQRNTNLIGYETFFFNFWLGELAKLLQGRQKGPAMSHELHDYAEIYTPSREEPTPWIGPQVPCSKNLGSVRRGRGEVFFSPVGHCVWFNLWSSHIKGSQKKINRFLGEFHHWCSQI